MTHTMPTYTWQISMHRRDKEPAQKQLGRKQFSCPLVTPNHTSDLLVTTSRRKILPRWCSRGLLQHVHILCKMSGDQHSFNVKRCYVQTEQIAKHNKCSCRY